MENYISQCYQDRLEGRIDADFWQTKTEAWRLEQGSIEERLRALRGAKSAYLDEGVRLLEIANNAAELFQDLEGDEKREMLSMLLSNPRILNGNLDFSFKNPFALFTNVVNLNEMRS